MKLKRMRYSRKKVFLVLFLFLLVFGIGIGYAFITSTLEISGVAKVKDAKWDIHFTNYNLSSGSVSPNSDPTIADTSITFSAKVNDPGDYYGFTIDVVNAGTINATVNNFAVTPDFSTIDYLDASFTYDDGTPIQAGDILAVGRTKTIKVLLSYKDGINEDLYPTTDQSFNVTLSIGYEQYMGKAANWVTDSWDDIIVAYDLGKTSNLVNAMNNGTTRIVQFDLNNDGTLETYHLRIVNLSKPSECNTTGFSQTACGFVVEFSETITNHILNPYTNGSSNGDGNKGGWQYSDMRAYLNGTTYTAGNVDYSNVGIIDALPSGLKNSIITTTVVSGYGAGDSSNYVTTDKLYLLDATELYGNTYVNENNKAKYNERQLDYYNVIGVTPTNYSPVAKLDMNGSPAIWWLRSADNSDSLKFFRVYTGGGCQSQDSTNVYGVSPAFRIAE